MQLTCASSTWYKVNINPFYFNNGQNCLKKNIYLNVLSKYILTFYMLNKQYGEITEEPGAVFNEKEYMSIHKETRFEVLYLFKENSE